MPHDLAVGSGHVLVCGLHGVGLRTVEQLHRAGSKVTVLVDYDDARRVSALREMGVTLVMGSSRDAETLKAAGLGRASAVVCVLSHDLATLETALLVRDLRPEVRIVVQLRNPAVGRALVDIDMAVLDVAGLSAPSLVEACLRTGTHTLDISGIRFTAAQATADRHGSLRDLFGDLAPVAVKERSTEDLVLCPGRDHVVSPGDLVTVLGTDEELRASGIPTSRPVLPASRRRRNMLASLFGLVDRRLFVALMGVLSLIVVSVVVLRERYVEPDGTRMSTLDALYFAIETLATVGYGDFNFRQQEASLRLFAIALMAIGAVAVTVFFALLTNLYVSRGIAEVLGRRLVTWLSGHVIVVGLGSIGIRVVEQLRAAGAEVVAIDLKDDNRYLAQARSCGARVVVGDGTLPQTLRSVGLSRAAAVAVLTNDDLVNLETGLAVRDELGSGWPRIPVVLRLFDRKLSRTVERNFGFRFVRSTAELAAPWFVGAALGLDVLGTFYVTDHPMLVGRLVIARGGGLDGLAMEDLSARTRVIAISRAAEGGVLEHPPRRDTTFGAGDVAFLVGPYEDLLTVLRRDSPSVAAGSRLSEGCT